MIIIDRGPTIHHHLGTILGSNPRCDSANHGIVSSWRGALVNFSCFSKNNTAIVLFMNAKLFRVSISNNSKTICARLTALMKHNNKKDTLRSVVQNRLFVWLCWSSCLFRTYPAEYCVEELSSKRLTAAGVLERATRLFWNIVWAQIVFLLDNDCSLHKSKWSQSLRYHWFS